jgi:pseudouridine synthase
VRLQKFIASCGTTSRRRAELLIQAGRVAVNGRVQRSLGSTIDPERDKVTVNGEEINVPVPLTILFNKPPGIITSTHDTHDRLTVMDLLPRSLKLRGVLPVGRLDQDTEGLLVLTNDGDLAHRITHPSYETEKEYDALVLGTPSPGGLARLEAGMILDGEKTSPARIVSVASALPEDLPEEHRKEACKRVRIVIHEGKKRQVRRMFEVIGNPVIRLRRLRIGGLSIGSVPEGQWRELAPAELKLLLGN